MDSDSNIASGVHPDETFETFFRSILTKKVSKNAFKKFQLIYIPDYIRELRNKKDYWEEEYRKYQDDISLKNWRSFQKQFSDEVRKHKTILKNLDEMWRVFVHENEFNYFSQSIDPERVQSMVDYLKENQSNYNVFYDLTEVHTESQNHHKLLYRMLGVTPGRPKDFENFLYVMYSIWALYGEFRVRPPGSTAVQVKEE